MWVTPQAPWKGTAKLEKELSIFQHPLKKTLLLDINTESEEVAEKILRHSEALGGVSRFTFQMDNAHLPQEKLLRSIELIGTKVIPLVAKG